MTFPLQIRQLRRALDLTQAECAAVLDVCPQSICNWEAGRSLPWEKDREGYLAALKDWPPDKMAPAQAAEVMARAAAAPKYREPLGETMDRWAAQNRSMGSDDTATINPPKLSETRRMRRRIGDML